MVDEFGVVVPTIAVGIDQFRFALGGLARFALLIPSPVDPVDIFADQITIEGDILVLLHLFSLADIRIFHGFVSLGVPALYGPTGMEFLPHLRNNILRLSNLKKNTLK